MIKRQTPFFFRDTVPLTLIRVACQLTLKEWLVGILTHYNPANFLSLIFFKFFTHVLLRNLRGLSSSEFSKNSFFSLLVIKSKKY